MDKITISAFQWVPPFAQGLVRDLRVRWALEEAGCDYDVMLLDATKPRDEEYFHLQPYGQVPIYKEGDLVLFESGAIVLHIADKTRQLMPDDPIEKSRAISWMFSALNTIEPHMLNLSLSDLFHSGESWAKEGRPVFVKALEGRLDQLAKWLEGKEYLEGEFTAGDLLMTTVLRIPRHTDILAKNKVLHEYVERCEARPAFQRALEAQLAPFAKNTPKSSKE